VIYQQSIFPLERLALLFLAQKQELKQSHHRGYLKSYRRFFKLLNDGVKIVVNKMSSRWDFIFLQIIFYINFTPLGLYCCHIGFIILPLWVFVLPSNWIYNEVAEIPPSSE